MSVDGILRSQFIDRNGENRRYGKNAKNENEPRLADINDRK